MSNLLCLNFNSICLYSLLPSVFTNVGRGVLDPRNTPTVGAPFELKLLKPHRFSVSEGIFDGLEGPKPGWLDVLKKEL